MATTNKGSERTESTKPADDFEKRQKAAEQVERQNELGQGGGATPTEEAKKKPQNHEHRGDKPHPDHADQPAAGSGEPAGEKDGRGQVFDQDRSPKNIDYAAPRAPNEDPFSGSVDDRRS